MSVFNKKIDGTYRLVTTMKFTLEISDLFYALSEHPTHQSRNSIINNAKSFYSATDGFSLNNPYPITAPDMKIYLSIISRVFPEIPVSELHEAIEKIRQGV